MDLCIDILNCNTTQFEIQFVNEVKKMYCLHLLNKNMYKKAYKYIQYVQPVSSPNYNIFPHTMSFFKDNDTNKTLLIYFSGGIGDIIMHARFIKKICEIQLNKKNSNKILFLVEDKLFWLYDYIYKNVYTHINNIQIIPFTFKNNLPIFHYHTNINMLFSYLSLDYSDIYVDYYLEFLPNLQSNINTQMYLKKNKANVIINWCGNPSCSHEKHNRGIPLQQLTSLFKKTSAFINWICVQKNISKNEENILKTHDVQYVGNQIDNNNEGFKDTIVLLKQVDLVISTDTSLIHVAGTANVPSWCLLTKGCEWRWADGENTNWYPNIILIQQKVALDWSHVIEKVLEDLQTKFN